MVMGYIKGMPSFVLPLMIPMMVIGGGLEEAGWRGVLLPEMEKRFSFTFSSIIVGIIWVLWHLPLFFIDGVPQSDMNYFIFGIGVLSTSFALASIQRYTKSIWLCVLFHAINNSLSAIFIINETLVGSIICAAILIALSYAVLHFANKRKSGA